MGTLDSIPGAGLLVDEENVIVDVNNRCGVVFKQGLEQIRDEPLAVLQRRELVGESARRQWEDAVSAVLGGVTDETTEQIRLRPGGSGEEVLYDLRVSSCDGDTERVCCSLRSVGTARRYDETITALHVSTRELMAADSVDEVLQRTADAASDVLGFPGTAVRRYDRQEELLHHVAFGGRVGNIESRPSYGVDESPHGRAIRRGETVIDTIEENDPYGREAFTETMYTPIGDDGLLSIGTVGRTFDETDVQFAEILAENAAAAIRVVETTETLRAERERLDRFASVVSHDLRNPLEIAMLYLDRARETGDEEDFDTAAGGLDRMERMIDDLLALARSGPTVEQPNAVDLHQLAQDAWETLRTPGVTIAFETSDGDTIECDPSLVQNLLENLFRNAVEHNDPPLTVRVGTLGNGTGFYVEDDGRGIPETERDSVLDHGYTTGTGTGLGLCIVGDIVDAHGWEVTVTESRDGGARFEITTCG